MRHALLGASLVLALCAGAQAQSDRLVRFKNDSDFTAYSIFVRPKGGNWSQDLLGDDVIRKGNEATVSFSKASGELCKFDIRITSDVEGFDWSLQNVDICHKQKRISLKGFDIYKKNGRVNQLPLINVTNNSDRVVLAIYAIRSDLDCCWSRDILGTKVIDSRRYDDQVDFTDGRPEGECKFDLRIVGFPLGKDWTHHGVFLCARDSKGKSTSRIVVTNETSKIEGIDEPPVRSPKRSK